MSTLYPAIEPFEEFDLAVSELHTIHVERVGNPDGKPALFLHGGPGGGIDPFYRQLFNPEAYHVILVDQRGAKRSTPHAELKDNTTWDLVADFEAIRQRLNIKQWTLVGGSWGSTLALAYAQKYPEVVSELILRGIFLGRDFETDWLYKFGASEIFPEAWQAFIDHIPANEQADIPRAYQKRLLSDDKEVRLAAAKAWSVWEASISKHDINEDMIREYSRGEFPLAFAGIENHYFMNQLFLEPNQLLDGCKHIEHIPMHIIQGRYDIVCPMRSAFDLHKRLPHSTLHVIPDAGHSLSEPGTALKHVELLDELVVTV